MSWHNFATQMLKWQRKLSGCKLENNRCCQIKPSVLTELIVVLWWRENTSQETTCMGQIVLIGLTVQNGMSLAKSKSGTYSAQLQPEGTCRESTETTNEVTRGNQ